VIDEKPRPVVEEGFDQDWLLAHRVDIRGLSLGQIVGIGQVVGEVNSLIGRLRNPEIVRSAGAEMPRGILFHGPPGVGKTLTARVIASLIGEDVPFFEVSSDELTAARIRGTVRYLSGLGNRSVLYIDEIDGFARDRSDPRHSPESRQLLYAALAALDGLTSGEGLILIASTNDSPWQLDAALLRAGRIGFRIEFGLPDQEERVALLKHFSKGREFEGPVDLERIARVAEECSPADIRQILDDALGVALGDARLRPTQPDIMAAARRRGVVEPERGNTDSRERIAFHEAGHAIVAVSLVGPAFVRSIRVSASSGATKVGDEWELDGALSETRLRELLAVSYGGLAAERHFVLGGSRASLDDFTNISQLLMSMAASGLIEDVPPLSPAVFRRLAWRDLRRQLGAGVTRVARAAQVHAERAVVHNTPQVFRLATQLAEIDELSGPELQLVLEDLQIQDTGPIERDI
jgi:cell division protease FtsH